MTATGFLLFVEPLFAQFGSLVHVSAISLEDLWSITIVWLLLTMLSGGRLTSRVDKMLVGLFVLEFALEVTWHLFLDDPATSCSSAPTTALAAAIEAASGLLVSVACVATAVVDRRALRARLAGRAGARCCRA